MKYLTIYNTIIVGAFNLSWLIMAGSFKEYLCFYKIKQIGYWAFAFYAYAIWGIINLTVLL